MSMGYACPVCEIPQQDAEHLAHHLAFTAMLHGDSHETWLDEHTPGWETAEPVSLGEEIAEDVAEAEYKQVFEDTSQSHNHNHDHAHDSDGDLPGRPFNGSTPPSQESRPASAPDVGAETSAVLEEARELTRQMLADEEADDDDDDDDSDEDEAEAGAAEPTEDSSDDHA